MQFSALNSTRNPTSERKEPIFTLHNPPTGAGCVNMLMFPSTLLLHLARRTVFQSKGYPRCLPAQDTRNLRITGDATVHCYLVFCYHES